MAPEVDFYLYATHEVPTLQPIVAVLRRLGVDAAFVLEPPGRNIARGSVPDPRRGWRDDKSDGTMGALLDAPTARAIEAQLTAAGERHLTRRRPGAAAVTTSAARWLRPYAGAWIRCMYGLGPGVEAFGHGAVNADFDVVLAHGPVSVEAIRRAVPGVPTAITGFPKWAAHRRGEVTRADARTRLGLPSDGTVVAWLPTWAHHSSLDAYRDALEALAGDATVVLKPHHNTARFEGTRLAGIEGVHQLQATDSLVDVLTACDVAIADIRSGAVTEAILADRPGVVVAPDGPPAGLHPVVEPCVRTCAGPDHLSAAVEAALGDRADATRRAAVSELFGDTGGKDDELAAEAVIEAATRQPATVERRVRAWGYGVAYRAARAVGR